MNDDSSFNIQKLDVTNFWNEISSHIFPAFLYTVRRFWFLFILGIILGVVLGEIFFRSQVPKYHAGLTLQYGSIENGLKDLKSVSSMANSPIGIGVDKSALGAVESFGQNFSGAPHPSDTENNFGLKKEDLVTVINQDFLTNLNLFGKMFDGQAIISTFETEKGSALLNVRASGAVRGEVLTKVKELSDHLESIFMSRKRVIVEKINERLTFSREEYALVSSQLKEILRLEKEFGRTSEIVSKKNTLLTQELGLRASLSEILAFKGENYIKDFEVLNVSVSPVPIRYFSRVVILPLFILLSIGLTFSILVILFFVQVKRLSGFELKRNLKRSNLEDSQSEKDQGKVFFD
jgi:uncharacterized membrane protein YciS (DUF1049 family)